MARSSRAAPVWLPRAAWKSGVWPWASRASSSAPAAARDTRTLVWPRAAAQCSGVMPVLERARGSAPRLRSRSTISRRPAWAAKCSGVSPFSSIESNVSGQSFNNATTCARSPTRAASWIGKNNGSMPLGAFVPGDAAGFPATGPGAKGAAAREARFVNGRATGAATRGLAFHAGCGAGGPTIPSAPGAVSTGAAGAAKTGWRAGRAGAPGSGPGLGLPLGVGMSVPPLRLSNSATSLRP